MRGSELLDKMALVEPAYIAAADATPVKQRNGWIKWGAMAACLCLVAAAAAASALLPPDTPAPPYILETSAPTPTNGQQDDPAPEQLWTAYYNDVTTVIDAARLNIPGYFTEELSRQDIAAVTPGKAAEWMAYTGHAGFDGEGNLMSVFLNTPTTVPNASISVAIHQNTFYRDYSLPDVPNTCVCNGVEYRLYQLDLGSNRIGLEADAIINGCYFTFSMDTASDQLAQTKADFEQALECFTHYAQGLPNLVAITPEAIPEYYDRKLTLLEAQADADFGPYMLPSIPAGFEEESIRRFRDQNSNYLSGLWTRGYDDLRWRVYAYGESDAARLTSVADTQNYDLSLYPIPQAESVPEELREIVDNPIFKIEELTLDAVYARAYKLDDLGDSGGWRMRFSVKYDDMIVEISTKGIEPEWLYQQLTVLCNP